ncbi:MAG: outer membrane beta-barrel protein, partial [Limisphaerales bacterium]
RSARFLSARLLHHCKSSRAAAQLLLQRFIIAIFYEMKSKKLAGKKKTAVPFPLKTTLFSLLVLSRAAEAQEATLQTQSQPVEPLWQQNQTNQFQVFVPQAMQANLKPQSYEPFQWGTFLARPHLNYQFIDASGILSAPGEPEHTTIQQVSPGILFNVGDHWALDYTPTLAYYSNNHFRNQFDNAIVLTAGTDYQDWVFGFSQSYVSASSPQIETALQTKTENYVTTVSASYILNGKLSVDMAGNQDLEFAENFQNFRDWSTTEWLNYQFHPRFDIGIGGGLGYENVDLGSDQTYEQMQGRMNWRPTDKISFQINGGFEEREFLGSGGGTLFSPIFGATIQYLPFSHTQISFSGSQSVSATFFAGEHSQHTSLSVNLSQRLLQKFHLNLNGGYNVDKYVTDDLSFNRTDDYYSFGARLSHPFLKRGMLSLVYQYTDNKSTEPGYTFSSNQVGVEVGYSY